MPNVGFVELVIILLTLLMALAIPAIVIVVMVWFNRRLRRMEEALEEIRDQLVQR